ncbi:hypothetical protein [Pseudobdellovibrio exovorus]|uniref:Uncharacterized protein n=1 Tax=Pseudobdellovibrio exovorus JSS TaxID=1184267 RepID=M4V7J9_9BACT|nr:hypothetical protein [Pseudobdellovibrio exovorus]AGH95372.1 hypothetical protein A11Q_1156 [Pseudobdellovibrio exovorus JSS]
MRTHKNNFLIISLLFLASVTQAQEVLQFNAPVTGFIDYTAPQNSRLVFITENGVTSFIQEERIQTQRRFRIAHNDCKPTSQSTVSMDQAGGLTLAYPFLAGTNRLCYFDEKAGAIRLLSNFTSMLPSNTFSAVYAGAQNDDVYFLINGRVFPQAKAGYILLLTVNKQTLQISVRELITEVPDYSGGMLFEQNKIWINTYPNRIFRVLLTDLHQLIRQKKSIPFSQIAIENFRSTDAGLNSFVLNNKNSFLYFNDEYESYIINRKTGFKTTVQPTCLPVAGRSENWLVLCNGNSLQIWTP